MWTVEGGRREKTGGASAVAGGSNATVNSPFYGATICF